MRRVKFVSAALSTGRSLLAPRQLSVGVFLLGLLLAGVFVGAAVAQGSVSSARNVDSDVPGPQCIAGGTSTPATTLESGTCAGQRIAEARCTPDYPTFSAASALVPKKDLLRCGCQSVAATTSYRGTTISLMSLGIRLQI